MDINCLIKMIRFHVSLDEQTKTTGVIMCEQVKALDLRVRKASFLKTRLFMIFVEKINI